MFTTEQVNINYLNKYMEGKKHKPVNMGDILIQYMVEDSVNKIESQIWKGLDNSRDKDLQELLYKSDFKSERQEAADWYGVEGEIFTALILIDNEYVISFFKPINYEVIKTNVIEMIAEGIGTVKSNYGQKQLYYRWRTAGKNEINPNTKENISGRIVRETFYFIGLKDFSKDSEKKINETFIYPKEVKFVPGKLIRNNAKSTPDWIKAGTILQEMNLLSNDIGVEWENIKTIWRNVGVFGKGKQSSKQQESLNNGGRNFSDHSKNSQYAQQFGVMMSGSSTLTTLIQSVAFMEDRALKYTFQGRDMDASGNNKHNMQVGLFNQAHSEYIVKKKEQRERDFTRFFRDVVEPITGIVAPKSISIQNSAYEQGKEDALKMLDNQSKLYKAQAKSQKESAEKSAAEAEKKKAETKKINSDSEVNVPKDIIAK